jgi:hypothetical protein
VGRILGGGWGVGGLKKGGTLRGLRIHRDVNLPQAANPSNTAKDGPIAPDTS